MTSKTTNNNNINGAGNNDIKSTIASVKSIQRGMVEFKLANDLNEIK